MEYQINREMFLDKLNQLCDKLSLNDSLLKSLDKYFKTTWSSAEKLSKERVSLFLLTELTRTRYSCAKFIEILINSGDLENEEIASELQVLNVSPVRRDYPDDSPIEVIPSNDSNIKHLESMAYPMSQEKRGIALIINNVRNLAKNESERFKSACMQLRFDVRLAYDLTADQMVAKMSELKNEINNDFDVNDIIHEAILCMFISHGDEEHIYGVNANRNDSVKKNVLVDTLNSELQYDNILKLFVFTACRDITGTIDKSDTLAALQCETYDGSDTMVICSCAEGYKTFVEDNLLYTYFGRCFSETIAQYAYKDNLVQILNRTNKVLRHKYGRMGYFTPEATIKGLNGHVYFNPHWFKGDS